MWHSRRSSHLLSEMYHKYLKLGLTSQKSFWSWVALCVDCSVRKWYPTVWEWQQVTKAIDLQSPGRPIKKFCHNIVNEPTQVQRPSAEGAVFIVRSQLWLRQGRLHVVLVTTNGMLLELRAELISGKRPFSVAAPSICNELPTTLISSKDSPNRKISWLGFHQNYISAISHCPSIFVDYGF